jgi:hypothetical protein
MSSKKTALFGLEVKGLVKIKERKNPLLNFKGLSVCIRIFMIFI